MAMQGHGAGIAILVAFIGVIGALGAPVVQRYLEDHKPPTISSPAETVQPTPTSSPRGAFLRTTKDVSLRENPRSNAAIIQEVPAGTIVSPGVATAVDNEGVTWVKIQVNGGTAWGWTQYPVPEEPIFVANP